MVALTQKEAVRRYRPIYYPDGDGKPMGETQTHVRLIAYATEALDVWYTDRSDVYVAGNNFVYYEEGNPKKQLSPDTYVVFGVPKRDRDSYFTWREGNVFPSVLFEFTSKSTQREDLGKKFRIYEQVWRAAEYILFDPKRHFLQPPLQGFHLVNGVYVPMPLREDGRLVSELLGLEIAYEGDRMRFYDPVGKRWIIGTKESQAELAVLQKRVDLEALRAELATQRAEEESRRAQEEALRAANMEAENARLRAELEALKQR